MMILQQIPCQDVVILSSLYFLYCSILSNNVNCNAVAATTTSINILSSQRAHCTHSWFTDTHRYNNNSNNSSRQKNQPLLLSPSFIATTTTPLHNNLDNHHHHRGHCRRRRTLPTITINRTSKFQNFASSAAFFVIGSGCDDQEEFVGRTRTNLNVIGGKIHNFDDSSWKIVLQVNHNHHRSPHTGSNSDSALAGHNYYRHFHYYSSNVLPPSRKIRREKKHQLLAVAAASDGKSCWTSVTPSKLEGERQEGSDQGLSYFLENGRRRRRYNCCGFQKLNLLFGGGERMASAATAIWAISPSGPTPPPGPEAEDALPTKADLSDVTEAAATDEGGGVISTLDNRDDDLPLLSSLNIYEGPDELSTTSMPMYNNNLNVASLAQQQLQKQREPLRFMFRGHAIWLELEQVNNNDISRIISDTATELGVLPIPEGHVTAMYGTHWYCTDGDACGNRRSGDVDLNEVAGEQMLRQLFLQHVTIETFASWPTFRPVGVLVDVELNGVNGGVMDMAWSELSYAASPDHEEYLGKLRSIFHPDSQSPLKTSSSRWRPHLSIAYDNPENTVLSLPHTVQMIAKIPSLVTHGPRKVVGISLWRTRGNMIEWTCLERIQL